MTILAMDTSGQTAGAAIINDYITVGELNVNAQTASRKTHSEVLMPLVDRLFEWTGLRATDVDYIACTNGPGSFTGLRIGAASALGLARGLNKPIIPVPTLDALAYNATDCETGTVIAPMMDARRGEVYAAIYRIASNHDIERITDYMAAPVTEVLSALTAEVGVSKQRAFILGDGVPPHVDAITEAMCRNGVNFSFAPVNANRQRAASVALCAWRMTTREAYTSSDLPLLYIRKPQAERQRERMEMRQDRAIPGC